MITLPLQYFSGQQGEKNIVVLRKEYSYKSKPAINQDIASYPNHKTEYK